MKSALAVFSLLLLAMVGVSTGDDAQGQQQQYQQFGQPSPTNGMDPNMMLMMVSQRMTYCRSF